MENMRIHGSVIESAEFRHGPAEMLDRRGADMAVLVGTDESRAMTLRTLEFAGGQRRAHGGLRRRRLRGRPPAADPVRAEGRRCSGSSSTATLIRGIEDLDDRAYMGRQVLAKEGATWP